MPLAVLTRSVTGRYGGSISLDLGLSTVSFSPPPPLDSFVAVATVTAVPRDRTLTARDKYVIYKRHTRTPRKRPRPEPAPARRSADGQEMRSSVVLW